MAKCFYIILLLILLPILITAQYDNPSSSSPKGQDLTEQAGQRIKFERLSVEQGLSHNRITCFLQDKRGFLWIGTQDGLNKYDGNKFTIYRHNPNDSASISSDRIWSIYEDKTGIIWSGTLDGGLSRFDPHTESFRNYINDTQDSKSISNNAVTAIAEDKSGILWIGTLRGGLNRFDKITEEFTRYQNNPKDKNSLSNNSVLAVCVDQSNEIWVGTWGGGINKFDRENNNFFYYKNETLDTNSLSSNVIWSIYADRKNTLWIGTMDGGLNRFERDTEKFIRYIHKPGDKNSISQNTINLIYEDLSGRLWIGTWGGGLDEFDRNNEKFNNYRHNPDNPNSLSHNEIKSIYQDRSGVIWIGTNGGGLNKLDPHKQEFNHYKHIPNINSLSHNNVWSLYTDKSGMIWIGTIGGGLNKFDYDKQQFRHFKYDPNNQNSLSHNSVISILEDKTGMLWIGTINGGLNKFDQRKQQFTRYYSNPENPHSISHNFIPCIFEDKSGNLWIGTWGGGLCLYDRRSDDFIRYQHDPNNSNSLSDNIIWTIVEDRYGNLWLGTETGGLNKFNPKTGKFKHYKHEKENPKSLSNNTIWSIYEDKSGNLWIGTAGAGLNKFDFKNETFHQYTTEDGLPNNMINKIIEDNHGNLWLSTNKGFSKFNPVTETFKNYDVEDGLQNNQFNFNAACKGPKGEFIFGGINGFNMFHPDSLQTNLYIPSVILVEFRLFNKPVKVETPIIKDGTDKYYIKKSISYLQQLELNYKENIFSFEFAALDYHSPEKNKYAYKMEGVDPDWVYTNASRRFATYTNLDPGEYTFRVKGSNNDGIWNEEGTSIKVIILPPWWKTNWAYIIYIFLFISIAVTTWRAQLRRIHIKQQLKMEHFEAEKLKEVDHLKSRFFANISHEFRTPLTLILGPVKQMLTGKFSGNFKEQYRMIIRNGERLLKLINELLDLSKLESGEMKLQVSETDIAKYLNGLVLSFSSWAERKNISLKLGIKEKKIIGFIDRDKFDKIVTNLLSNAFKFTPEGGVVEVSITPLPSASPLIHKGGIKGGSEEGVQITVSNTGSGIPAEQIDKIFDRFYQMDDNYKKDSEGSGIGLALTKELVEVCHGEISVESIPDKTTSFTLTLPIAKENFKENQIIKEADVADSRPETEEKINIEEENIMTLPDLEKQSPASRFRSPLLLIVEDNPDVTNYICSFMENDYRIVTAENGKIGLKKTLDKYPDLIISDVMMPEMDGFELCHKIKSDERISHIPVILLTAKANLSSKIEGLEFGADDYVTKPFEARELKIRVKNLIEQRRKLREKFSALIDLQPADIAASSMDEQLLQRLLDVFEDHIEEPDFTTEEFAREVGLSRMHLNRKLQALTNLSTHDFIRTLRLQRAATLLSKASGTVSEIAYKVGFNNLSHFSKAFHRHFGKLPSEFSSKKN